MHPEQNDIHEDVTSYIELVEDDDPLAWYAYMTLQTQYQVEEVENRPVVRIGGKEEYPDPDTVYSLYSSPPRDTSSRWGSFENARIDASPSTPRIEVRKPPLSVYAAAFNEFVDDPEVEDTIHQYLDEVWTPRYRDIEPVWEFLQDVPPQIENEEELMEMAEGYGDGVAPRLLTLLEGASGRAHTVDDYRDYFEDQLQKNQYWLSVVHRLEHQGLSPLQRLQQEFVGGDASPGVSLRELLREDMMDQMDQEYYVTGDEQESVYQDGTRIYVIDSSDGEKKRMERVDVGDVEDTWDNPRFPFEQLLTREEREDGPA
ncbi:MAG: hypothetical protein SVW77_00970 [Candidatus Nanohaloarchaea archaeon]|nr:hypothetical protein [Candidatus Nanohaloarchaea archaeon]